MLQVDQTRRGKKNRFAAEIFHESQRIFFVFDISKENLMCSKQSDKEYRPFGSLGKRSS